MVVFTCNHCGDSLQKPRVVKHYETTCRRNPKLLTCVDCLKDFRLEEYAVHTQCVTEQERYAAKGVVIGAPKGRKKQETWVEIVHNVIEEQKSTVSQYIKEIFDFILLHPNIPKKKKPFINHLTSSSGGKIKQQDIETVWNILEAHKPKPATPSGNKESVGNNDDKEKKSKQAKDNETNDESVTSNETSKKTKKSKKSETAGNESKVEETSAETDKKSKKKRKLENGDENKIEPDILKTDEYENGSKKKKKRKSQVTAENGETNGHQENAEDENIQENDSKVEGTDKKSKKKRKSENGDENKIEPDIFKTDEDENSPKKKKKRKSQMTAENGETNGHQENAEEGNIQENDSKVEGTDKKSEDGDENKIEPEILKKDEDENGSKKKKKRKSQVTADNGETNGHQENGEDESPNKKQKTKEIEFLWKVTITEILQKKPDGMSIEKLQKKVFKKYENVMGAIENKEKLIKTFNKKLKGVNNISCDNDLVKITV